MSQGHADAVAAALMRDALRVLRVRVDEPKSRSTSCRSSTSCATDRRQQSSSRSPQSTHRRTEKKPAAAALIR